MALNSDSMRERLRETFGSDSQGTIGRKLNMTQGNVSKLLSGVQQPTIDTLYRIAETYGVSVDWLMGLSDRKKSIKINSGITYGAAVEVLNDLIFNGAEIDDRDEMDDITISIADPIIKKLLKKSRVLAKADWELFQNWKNSRLSLFDDKTVLATQTYRSHNLMFLEREASSELNLLELYEEAKKEQDEFEEIMNDSPGPFKD